MGQLKGRKAEQAPQEIFLSGLQQAGYSQKEAQQMLDIIHQLRSGRGNMIDIVMRFEGKRYEHDIINIMQRWDAVAPKKTDVSRLTDTEISRITGAAFGPQLLPTPRLQLLPTPILPPALGPMPPSQLSWQQPRIWQPPLGTISPGSRVRPPPVKQIGDCEFEVTLGGTRKRTYKLIMPKGFKMPTTLEDTRRLIQALRNAAYDFDALQPRKPALSATPKRSTK